MSILGEILDGLKLAAYVKKELEAGMEQRRKKPRTLNREQFERQLFGELSTLIPDAIAQAKKGKPALLRILTRAAGRPAKLPEEDDAGTPQTVDFGNLPRPKRD